MLLEQAAFSKLTESYHFPDFLQEHTGEVKTVTRVSEGLIHHVFKVVGEKQTCYLKIRGNYYSALPDIPSNPEDIRYERDAISLLSKIEPQVFPHLLYTDERQGIIVITDIMPDDLSLRTLFDQRLVDREIIESIGETIGRVHNRLRTVPCSIREDGEEECYQKNLYYRLGYHNNPALNILIEQLREQPRQLILGDLSPKNIGVNRNGRITMCDLELVHLGNPIFDVGFLAGHILIHSADYESGKEMLSGFFDGYTSEQKEFDLDDPRLKQLSLGVTLFRLHNPVIPYELPLTEKVRQEKVNKASSLLEIEGRSLSWFGIIHELAYE